MKGHVGVLYQDPISQGIATLFQHKPKTINPPRPNQKSKTLSHSSKAMHKAEKSEIIFELHNVSQNDGFTSIVLNF